MAGKAGHRQAGIWDLNGPAKTIKKVCIACDVDKTDDLNSRLGGGNTVVPEPDNAFSAGEITDPVKIELCLSLIPPDSVDQAAAADSPTEGKGEGVALGHGEAGVLVWKTEGTADIMHPSGYPFAEAFSSPMCVGFVVQGGERVGKPMKYDAAGRLYMKLARLSPRPIAIDFSNLTIGTILPFATEALSADDMADIAECIGEDPASISPDTLLALGTSFDSRDAFNAALWDWTKECILL